MAIHHLDLFVIFGIAALIFYFLRYFFKGGVCYSKKRLDGKTVVVTGCNTGIGKETVLDMSMRGAKVVMACRNLDLANKAAEDVRRLTNGDIAVYRLDLASLKSIRECALEILSNESRIDILINNAGVMMCPALKTEDGFEMQIGTNHFGHFLFTNLLLDKIKKSSPARIVTVSSKAHVRGKIDLDDINSEKKEYSRIAAYGQSKLANILFSLELSKKLQGSGVTTYSLHPGVVRTELGRHIEDMMGPLKFLAQCIWPLMVPFTKTPAEGAQTSIYCAVDESLDNTTGKYYSDCTEKKTMPQGEDEEMAKKLWDLSARMVKL